MSTVCAIKLEKDIIYNRDLLLATSKMEKNDVDSNAPYIDMIDKKTINDVVIPFYRNNGINIENTKVSFEFLQYENILKDIIHKFRII